METYIWLIASVAINFLLVIKHYKLWKDHKFNKRKLDNLDKYVDSLRYTLDSEYKKFMEGEIGKR